MASLQELTRRLVRLDVDMPELKRRYPNRRDLISEFNSRADHITDEASAADVNWAFEQVDLLLAKHGLVAYSDDVQIPERARHT